VPGEAAAGSNFGASQAARARRATRRSTNPPSGALAAFQGEAFGFEILERLAQQVIAFDPQRQRLQQALAQ
jgi:hypothetical protein